MRNNKIIQHLNHRLESLGLRWSTISIKHLEELSGEINLKHSRGEISDEVYQAYINDFDTSLPHDMSNATSIIIVASPQPQYQVGFTKDGTVYDFTLPPTYMHHTDDEVSQLLKSVLEPFGYHFTAAWIPEKLVAARSGLACYGRNNISYVEGMGSFYRIRPFYTNVPYFEDHWQEAEIMDACNNCSACVNSCPTGALSKDRFILKADKCITFFNETSVHWPHWVEKSWDLDSKCIVGCMKCQVSCPRNRVQKKWRQSTEIFTQQETQELLQCKQKEELSANTIKKMDRLYLEEYIPTISRNLSVLFSHAES